jgi:hypothetical protein|tara:strand:+ start:528 stop:1238 length:711 start_codon:yes stop_codon:yes gene_type:complete
MRWNDLKTVIVEAGGKVRITITFESGVRININNVPKTVTTMPNFEETVQAAAQKAKPNETYSSWSISSGVDEPSGEFEPTEAEEEAMKNVSDLNRLIKNTFENSVRRGMTWDDKGYPEPRDVDPEFADGVSFEYSRDGKPYRIDDIKEEFNITVKINTKNPGEDEYGVNYTEGWPMSMNDWNDLKQMVIDAVDAGEHITTVGPAPSTTDDEGTIKITVTDRSFYYKRAIVYKTGDE